MLPEHEAGVDSGLSSATFSSAGHCCDGEACQKAGLQPSSVKPKALTLPSAPEAVEASPACGAVFFLPLLFLRLPGIIQMVETLGLGPKTLAKQQYSC